MTDNTSLRALGYIVFGATMVSFTSVLVEVAHTGPTETAFYRMFFGGLLLLVIALARGDRMWLGFRFLSLPFWAALFFSLDLFFWHRSIIYVGPGLATILGNMQVFFVALLAVWLLKERLSWQLMAAIPAAMAGLFLMVRTGWGQHHGAVKLGVLFGLLTALSYALYILVLRRSRAGGTNSPFSIFANMSWISLLSALLLGITVVVEPDAGFTIPDLQTWGVLLGLGLVGQVAGWVLISKGLPDVDASIGGLAILLQPALAFMWDILFFGRPTTTLEYLGAVIVLGGIYLGATGKKK
ncbi:DMT family transporter [Fodinibius sediminis]|uniref:Threonine/homoserine efflux transporter RhtA n=1 Tax=Fodinibius sediminis TaxID=1214077 RepID=A0A521ABN4_9BACT|nr:DMT family transporter [Fodinibius sediminis]SMO32224.1 Threonine/homoserine efflux transporter RhtA [Fodinibius sediminis]